MSTVVPGSVHGLLPRLRRAWKALHREQRLAAIGAAGLFGSMFLPWYQQTAFLASRGALQKSQDSLIAFQAWSFVEASILLVAIAVLVLLFARAERRAFHLPGGDGLVVLAAGAWVMLLVFYRQIDKPSGTGSGGLQSTVGVSWGIFVAFLFGGLIAYAGWRMQALHRPEPRSDGEPEPAAPVPPRPAAPRDDAVASRPRAPRSPDATAATKVAVPAEQPTLPFGSDARAAPRTVRRGDGQFEGQLSFEDSGDKPAAE